MSKVITFYSFKGGVGRSMSLANVGYLLAKWNYKVLMIDWDLEAPGLENFFWTIPSGEPKPYGLIDILLRKRTWQNCIQEIPMASGQLHLIRAGSGDDTYFKSVRSFDIKMFYEDHDGGRLIENLRDQWKKEYDYVLIDSRTGVTDIGGICTIQLPDILVLLFTATQHGFDGVRDVARKAIKNQQNLQLERSNLIALPVPARIERTAEYSIANTWLQRFAEGLEEIYKPWLPKGVNRLKFVENTLIPHIPIYSYGENLPVTDGMTGAGTLGYAYETLTAILANHLDYAELLNENRSLLVSISGNDYKIQSAAIKNEIMLKVGEKLMALDPKYYTKAKAFIGNVINEEFDIIEVGNRDKLIDLWVDIVYKKIQEQIPRTLPPEVDVVSKADNLETVNVVLPDKEEIPKNPTGRTPFYLIGGAVILALLAGVFLLGQIFSKPSTFVPEDSVRLLLESSRDRDTANLALQVLDTSKAEAYLVKSAIKALRANDSNQAALIYKEKIALGITENGIRTNSINDTTTRQLEELTETIFKHKITRIDVFYIRDGHSTSQPYADSIVKYLRTEAYYIVKKRELPISLLKSSGYKLAGNEVRFNPDEWKVSDDLIERFKVMKGVDQLEFIAKKISYPTPNYVSVFLYSRVTPEK